MYTRRWDDNINVVLHVIFVTVWTVAFFHDCVQL